MKKRKWLRRALFVLEMIVLTALLGGLYVYGELADRVQSISVAPEVTMNDDGTVAKGNIVTNEDAEHPTGYRTFALFGIDRRDQNAALAGQNSDTMIICSLNNDTKEIKLVSIYRDTLLNIGDDIYAKANAAYAYGGPSQAVNMLNKNLDLNITDYITVDFKALTEAVDAVGGLDVQLSYAEIVHLNNYAVETSEETGRPYIPVELPETVPENQDEIIGTYHLDGVQTTSYCRIRYTAKMDMGRTERQRYVIQTLAAKALTSGLPAMTQLMDTVLPLVSTSLNLTDILTLLPYLATGCDFSQTGGFPMNYRFSNVRGSIIVPMTLEENVKYLHEFLYGTVDYTPSESVRTYSEKILAIVGGAENTVDTAPVVTYEQGDAEDIFIWQDDGSGGNTYEEYGYIDPPVITEVTPDPAAPVDPAATPDPAAPADPATTPDPAVTTDPAAPVDPAVTTDPAAPADPAVTTDPAAPVDPGTTDTTLEPIVDTGSDGGGELVPETPVDTGGGDVSYDTGGGDVSYDTGGGDISYDTGGGDISYDTGGGYDESYDVGSELVGDIG